MEDTGSNPTELKKGNESIRKKKRTCETGKEPTKAGTPKEERKKVEGKPQLGTGYFTGKVTAMPAEDQPIFRVTYDDGDQEDLGEKELLHLVAQIKRRQAETAAEPKILEGDTERSSNEDRPASEDMKTTTPGDSSAGEATGFAMRSSSFEDDDDVQMENYKEKEKEKKKKSKDANKSAGHENAPKTNKRKKHADPQLEEHTNVIGDSTECVDDGNSKKKREAGKGGRKETDDGHQDGRKRRKKMINLEGQRVGESFQKAKQGRSEDTETPPKGQRQKEWRDARSEERKEADKKWAKKRWKLRQDSKTEEQKMADRRVIREREKLVRDSWTPEQRDRRNRKTKQGMAKSRMKRKLLDESNTGSKPQLPTCPPNVFAPPMQMPVLPMKQRPSDDTLPGVGLPALQLASPGYLPLHPFFWPFCPFPLPWPDASLFYPQGQPWDPSITAEPWRWCKRCGHPQLAVLGAKGEKPKQSYCFFHWSVVSKELQKEKGKTPSEERGGSQS